MSVAIDHDTATVAARSIRLLLAADGASRHTADATTLLITAERLVSGWVDP